jgi:hypothetical protein
MEVVFVNIKKRDILAKNARETVFANMTVLKVVANYVKDQDYVIICV